MHVNTPSIFQCGGFHNYDKLQNTIPFYSRVETIRLEMFSVHEHACIFILLLGGTPARLLRLIHKGKEMDKDDRTLSSYNVKNGDPIHLRMRFLGGTATLHF